WRRRCLASPAPELTLRQWAARRLMKRSFRHGNVSLEGVRDMSVSINWLPGSPFRPPHWPWLLASWMAATGREEHDLADEWVVAPGEFQRGSLQGGKHPAVAEAVYLFQHGPAACRDVLESYLLTNEPLSLVADRCSVPLPVVEAYSHIFCE